jgi:excisionase family DNA binding protein
MSSAATSSTTGAMPLDRLTFTTSEAAELLGVSARTLRRWRSQGILRGVRIGGKMLIRRDELLRMLRDNEERPVDRKAHVIEDLRQSLGMGSRGGE